MGSARLDPEVAAFVAQSDAAFPANFRDFDLVEQRRVYRDLCRAFETPRPPGLEVSDRRIECDGTTVGVRIYRPAKAGYQAALLYLHGGGWVFGDLDSHDGITAELAARAGIAVVAVDYRLAPEHRFPAAFDDCCAALEWLTGNAEALQVDAARIGVGGDSAGGGLAASLCLKERDSGRRRLCAQALVYPMLGSDQAQGPASLLEDAPLLCREELTYYWQAYLGGEGHADSPYAAPLLASRFDGLPRAYIQPVEFDPLRVDAESYAERLAAHGVEVELDLAKGLVHGGLRARTMSAAARDAFTRFCHATARLLSA